MPEFHAGDVVAKYRLEARAGGGGAGSVWRARQIDSGRVVAIKLLPASGGNQATRFSPDPELLAASAVSQSPHIVKVLDGGTEPVPYIVMEFVAGSNLDEELRQRRRLTQREVIEIGLAVAEALLALEAAGIIHRDVKPSNILIDRGGVVRLTDFGIAKIVGMDVATLTGQLPLSVSYAAPEAWEGNAGHQSDIYSLGVVLYQCLCGSAPFRGGYAELFYHHRSSAPDFAALPVDTVPSLAELIRASLNKLPAERPAGAAACIRLLERAKDELPDATETVEEQKEPERFGPWQRIEPVAQRPWTWRCRHQQSGETALVEVLFADSAERGEALRRAVAANRRLAPLGAERLIGTNRLILRPGEGWREAPSSAFQFWLAREDLEIVEPPAVVTAPMLLRAAESIGTLIEEAKAIGLPLNLDREHLTLMTDGSAYVRGAGIASESSAGPEADALEIVKSLPLTRDLRAVVARARDLEEIRKAAAVLVAVRSGTAEHPVQPEGPEGRRRRKKRLPILVAVAGAATAALLGGVFLLTGPRGWPPAPSPTAAPSAAEVTACQTLTLPASIAQAEAACANGGANFMLDASCAPGTACRGSVDAGGKRTIARNPRTLATIDASGNLTLSSEDGKDIMRLTSKGGVRSPVWSPDGRYLAYIDVLAVASTPSTPAANAIAPVQRYATQLRVIQADRPANDGIVIATSAGESAPDWQRFYLQSPQWSPDGRSIYFLWTLPDGTGVGLFQAGLPGLDQSNDIDFGTLRGAAPPTEPILTARIAALGLKPADFGVGDGYFGRFSVAADGTIFVQVCEGAPEVRRCGLGRWDGQAKLIRALEDNISYGAPLLTESDQLFLPAWKRGDGWRLTQMNRDGVASGAASAALFAPEDPLGLPAPFLASAASDGVIFESAKDELLRLSPDGSITSIGKGSAPSGFRARIPTPGALVPPLNPFATPAATLTPTATPTPAATTTPVYRPMTLLITVRKGDAPLASADVVALVGGVECAGDRTDATGRVTLTFPRSNAPGVCSLPGATIRFSVNRSAAATTTTFNPQGLQPVEIELP